MSTDADIFINKDSHQTRGRRTVEQSKPLETQTARPRHMLNELSIVTDAYEVRITIRQWLTYSSNVMFQGELTGGWGRSRITHAYPRNVK